MKKQIVLICAAVFCCVSGCFAQFPMGGMDMGMMGMDMGMMGMGGMGMEMPDYKQMAKAEVDSIIVPLSLDKSQVKKMVKILASRSEAKANASFSSMMGGMGMGGFDPMMMGGGMGMGGFTMPAIDTASINKETRNIDAKAEKKIQAVLSAAQLEIWHQIEAEKNSKMAAAMLEMQESMKAFAPAEVN